MRDYAELVNSLKNCLYIPCNEAQKGKCFAGKEIDCKRELMAIAANAIEELVSNADKFKWISAGERLPEQNADVLIYGEWIGSSGTKYREIYLTSIKEFRYQGYKTIAWMPLPAPPKSDR